MALVGENQNTTKKQIKKKAWKTSHYKNACYRLRVFWVFNLYVVKYHKETQVKEVPGS